MRPYLEKPITKSGWRVAQEVGLSSSLSQQKKEYFLKKVRKPITI
jgi:hypothetical protein